MKQDESTNRKKKEFRTKAKNIKIAEVEILHGIAVLKVQRKGIKDVVTLDELIHLIYGNEYGYKIVKS